ncbi:DegV family protein with EDD domain [Nocardioides albertanoniae]|uniref:DegV family protein with EDD domain n=1 Tax=Nocardioides albertanoniae TaxID=1175486 RepID=A0A543A524_9ACTN|nr:DegV family protein [Nocardioides albertanoniae]TQL67689.1 DegV family protein with EDD domain [Nocardioides albertanoniae]
MARVAIVTDSTAMLPSDLGDAAALITSVPLQVIVDGTSYDDGVDETSPAALLAALAAHKTVTTSRPSPALLAETYAKLAAEGFDEIVSIHLSAELSATCESSMLAAREAPVPVLTVDTRLVGPGVGFAVLAAAAVAARGGSATDARDAALGHVAASGSYFYVDTLEYLRRGGRIGAAAALLGTALAVKPLLTIEDGRVVPHARVRTAERAIARLQALGIEAADGEESVEVVVGHLGSPDRADAMAEGLASELGGKVNGDVRVGELGAVLGAHVGPGCVTVTVGPAL